MPCGKSHLRIEGALLAVWLAGAVLVADRGWIGMAEIVGFVVGYVVSMLLLSPDLDLARTDSYRRWGPVAWIWAPYAAAFRHRRISHHPLFGPITRIGYLAAIGWIVLFAYGIATRNPARRLVLPVNLISAVLIGIYLPNLTHIAADGAQSAWSRVRRRLFVR